MSLHRSIAVRVALTDARDPAVSDLVRLGKNPRLRQRELVRATRWAAVGLSVGVLVFVSLWLLPDPCPLRDGAPSSLLLVFLPGLLALAVRLFDLDQ